MTTKTKEAKANQTKSGQIKTTEINLVVPPEHLGEIIKNYAEKTLGVKVASVQAGNIKNTGEMTAIVMPKIEEFTL